MTGEEAAGVERAAGAEREAGAERADAEGSGGNGCAGAVSDGDEGVAEDMGEEGDGDDEPTAAPRAPVDPVDIGEEGLHVADSEDSVVMEYFRAIRRRLLLELSQKGKATHEWLLSHLRKNDFWLRASHSPTILRLLGVEIDGFEVEYIRDLRVWLPDLQGVRHEDNSS